VCRSFPGHYRLMTQSSDVSLLRSLAAIPARVLLGCIRLYQLTLSPVLPVVFGPNCGCRFYPSCSHYATEAVRTHGAIKGAILSVWRVLRCNPLSTGGSDPVPPVRQLSRPVCERVVQTANAR